MADDGSLPLLPDEDRLVARARAAGIDVARLTPLARRAVLREFRTPQEQAELSASIRETIEEDARLYSEHYQKYGLWNAHIRPW